MNYVGIWYESTDSINCSLAEFGNNNLVHGQAASDWVNREPDQWIKDAYVELERLGRLSPKDVVEIIGFVFKLGWEEDYEGDLEDGERKYEDLDEDDKEILEENTNDFFGISRDELLNTEQLNIDQFTKFCILGGDSGDECEIQKALDKFRRQELPAELAADLQRVREAVAAL